MQAHECGFTVGIVDIMDMGKPTLISYGLVVGLPMKTHSGCTL